MSDTDNLEQRLREFAAAPDDRADWEDVLRRSGERLQVGLPRRRLVLAVAAAFAVAATVVGLFVPFGTRHAPGGSIGPTGANGPTPLKGVTGLHGPTGPVGPTGYIGQGAFIGPTGYAGPTTGPLHPNAGPFPVGLTLSQLKEESKFLGRSTYWAGPRPGNEFMRYRRYFIVDYRPVRPDGSITVPFGLLVATYPFPDAFAALKKQAGGKAVPGPDGSIIYVNPHDPKSVLMAFPKVDYQVEIWDRSPAVALATAESGDIRPIGLEGPTGVGGPTGDTGPPGTRRPTGGIGPTGVIRPTPRIGPTAFTATQLKTESKTLRTPVYWAGPRDGHSYELTRTTQGYVYLLYLPRTPGNRLVVETSPFPGAFAALKKRADGKAMAGPDGSIIFVNTNPMNVSLAFPNVDYEIHVWDSSPAVALAIARSGDVRPAG